MSIDTGSPVEVRGNDALQFNDGDEVEVTYLMYRKPFPGDTPHQPRITVRGHVLHHNAVNGILYMKLCWKPFSSQPSRGPETYMVYTDRILSYRNYTAQENR